MQSKSLLAGIIIGVIIGIGGMAAVFVFSDLGTTTPIIKATVAFDTVDGELKVVGVEGTSETNPTILIRTGFHYELTVINNDSEPHSLVVGGSGIHTGILESGDVQTIGIFSPSEVEYTYFDGVTDTSFGKIKIVTVGPL